MASREYNMEAIKISSKEMFLYGEERGEWHPNEIEAWLQEHSCDQALADMCSKVSNHMGMLHHAYDDGECTEDLYESWDSAETGIIEEILARMDGSTPQADGRHYKIEPFMVAHGYRDGGGWWVPKNGDGHPASVYVPVCDTEKRKRILLERFSRCTLIEHSCEDEGFEHLETDSVLYEIRFPVSARELEAWIEFDGEITLNIGDWHSHYDWYEYGMQHLEWDIESIMSGDATALSLFAGENWIGSTLFRGNPRNCSYWQLLKIFHLAPEMKEKLKENGARFAFDSPVPGKSLEISYSWDGSDT